MRTCLAISLVATLAGVMLTGGCVSKEAYDEALAQNRRAQEQLEKLQEAYRQLQGENQNLNSKLKEYELATQKLKGDNDRWANQYRDLQNDFDALKKKYDLLVASARPPEILEGPILPAPLHKALEEFAKAYPELLTYLPKYGMIKLNADLTFEKGSDAALKFNVYIAGHTDDIPIGKPDTKRRHPTNWYLSVHRAVSVLKELAGDGLAEKRMGAMGFGEYHPVAPNAPGNKGNRLNRRVELWIVSPDRFLTLTGEAAAEPAKTAPESGS
jgi:chemotaxis protein MotB